LEEIRALVGYGPITCQVQVDGTPVNVEFTSDGTLHIEDHTFHVDVAEVAGSSLYSLLIDDASYEVAIDEEGGTYYALVRGKVLRIKVQGRASATSSCGTDTPSTGEVVVRAPMCGQVIEVAVAVEQSVEMNQGILTLESMKMEIGIRSPRAGIVREVRVKAGNIVREGDILAVVD